MSLWSRIKNTFRGDRLNYEIDEEFDSHIEEAIADGRDPEEVRRTFGSTLRLREQSRDSLLVSWLEDLRADIVFGWRQLMKRKVSTAAAVISLALAIGSCTSAFRLIDALLLRPLPIKNTDHLFSLSRQQIDWEGKPSIFDGWAYPDFTLMRAAAKGQAELIAVSYTDRSDLTYSSDDDMEKANVQYVSGWMFDSFGLRPALGRLFNESDDRTPGVHPLAVISYDYWRRRFGHNPNIIGKTFRLGENNNVYEIVGVAPKTFTGTEPGIITDVYLPTMMHPSVVRSDSTWHRTLAILQPGVDIEPLRAKLDAVSLNFESERAKGFKGMSQQSIQNYLKQRLLIQSAASGLSDMQSEYKKALIWIAILVSLVLLVACVNVANLMTAQAASRVREMALRISIGAGRSRLVQLVLVESIILALFSSALGTMFALWAAPFVVSRINPPDNPAHLILPADWRVLAFGVFLTLAVTLLFGLAPALRASAVQPVTALKGGDGSQTKRRSMHVLIAAQIALSFVVLFLAGLFVATLRHLSSQPLGFDPHGLLLLETVSPNGQPPSAWQQMADTLRAMPGTQDVAISMWPLMTSSNNNAISIDGGPPSVQLAYFLGISPGWIRTMKMQLLDGRDFNSSDANPGNAIVNQTFVRDFFKGANPVGKSFQEIGDGGDSTTFRVIGVVADTPYRNIRGPILPVAFQPYRNLAASGEVLPMRSGTFLLRTTIANPMTLAPELRRKVSQIGGGFRVSNIRTQQEIIDAQTLRERLLAMLGTFFSAVALLLAAIGLYGVLNYSVLQREREIGIRIAVGASIGNIARVVTMDIFLMVFVGAAFGCALGLASARYVQSLLYGIKGNDPSMLIAPAAVMLGAVILASLPAVFRAVRIDPATMLRAE